MFEEIIRKAWWKMFVSMMANRVIREGEHYLFQDGKLYVHFNSVYEAYINNVMECKKEWQLRVSSPVMQRIITGTEEYMFPTRKRLSKDANMRVLVFRLPKEQRSM